MTNKFYSFEKSDKNFSPEDQAWVTVKSKNLNGRGDILIVNDEVKAQSAPVIILLHGVYGSHWAWQYSVGLKQSIAVLSKTHDDLSEFVIAMPSDGLFGDGSAYLPIKGHGNYEKWIVEDVIDAVMQAVENVDSKSSIYIAGLSMGGYGALRLGCKYPTIFSGVSGHSSITVLDEMKLFVEDDLTVYEANNKHNADILYWAEKHRKKLPPIRFDCGKDDPLILGNRQFNKNLEQLDVTHHYQEFSGGHEFHYWAEHIQKSLLFFDQIEKEKTDKQNYG